MSGEGVLPSIASRAVGPMIRRSGVVEALEARASAVEDFVREDRVQAHSRQLPTESELAAAAYAARQLRVAADDFRGGLHDGTDAEPEETN